MGGLFEIFDPEISLAEKKRIREAQRKLDRADGAQRQKEDYNRSIPGTFHDWDGQQYVGSGSGSVQTSVPSLGPKPKSVPMPDKPYEISQTSYKVDYGTKTTQWTSYGGGSFTASGAIGNGVGTWNSFNSWDAACNLSNAKNFDLAEQRANQNIRKDAKNQTINLAVLGAEGVQTAELLLMSVTKIHRVVKSIKNLDVKSLKSLVSVDPVLSKKERKFHKKIDRVMANVEKGAVSPAFYADALLKLNWAWKPALNDTINAVDFLQGVPPQAWDVEWKRASYDRSRTNLVTQPDGSHKVLVAYRGWKRVGYTAKYQSRHTLIQLAKEVGFTNPLSVIYEKVPASYLIDYFYPLGKWLEGIDAFFGYECVSVVKTERAFAEWRSSPGPPHTNVWGETFSSNFAGYRKLNYFKRSIYTQMPSESLPSLRNPIQRSATHSGNIVALVVSNLARML